MAIRPTLATQISGRGLVAIVYTGLIATAIGFSFYYLVLKNLSVVRVSLIAFFFPMLALWLGNVLNQELLNTKILLGSGLILVAVMLFELFSGNVKMSGFRSRFGN